MGIELLAPAGNPEKLAMALHYGADAVYLAGKELGLRAYAGNFTSEEMARGIALAHEQGKKVYVTVNIFAHNRDFANLPAYLTELRDMGADAILVSDPGVFAVARRTVPDLPIHISTQANVTNAESARFWADQGAKRIVLARELSLAEIREIRQAVDIELEVFVHGAMCMSYSGRCMISDYLTGRGANRGECAQACRWKYALVEETRPGLYLPVEEDERGSYVFNARDLCLLPDIPALIDAGVDSFKIEGRMKSVHYVATVTQVYRRAVDSALAAQVAGRPSRTLTSWWEELAKISHRPYTQGFLHGPPGQEPDLPYRRDYDFVGVVQAYDAQKREAEIEVRNRIRLGDILELAGPGATPFLTIVNEMRDDEGNAIDKAPRPHQRIRIRVPRPVAPLDLVRRPKDGGEDSFLKVRINPSHIFYLDIILEGFGHLGVPTTVDKEAGLVLIRTTPDTREEVIRVLESLPWPAVWEREEDEMLPSPPN
ncbi:DUF4911 domain-containing protein [Heliobacterium undosum]|uniref:DUF4911 domain-containing protein n=1 Tax=Heliomicrobium undosum TaxID=121734 RepID=A0A845L3P2_9FIRM|nr:U32 family peptidase C-terminal domain-containing protein [Heliomicrobium undosum]MZP31257.1 DUF4911 domain-containing protein [Heliomicrobium undosum]